MVKTLATRILILTVALLSVVTSISAQDARSEIAANIRRTGSNYFAYPGPTRKQTAAPYGKKPFYISHYGRHGSRYFINPRDYDYAYNVLSRADSLGKLSPLGKDVFGRVTMIREEARGRLGELTPLGAEQHKQIARRMYQRFPQVFEGVSNIDAKSTVVIRCILSMENALQELLTLNPRLHIVHDASQHDMYYMNLSDKKLYDKKMSGDSKKVYDEYLSNHSDYKRAMGQLFQDTAYVAEEVNQQRLNYYLFKLASNLQSTELRKKITLYDLFTDDELYTNWQRDNAYWYMTYGPSPFNGGTQPFSQRNLLRRIIEEADSCLKLIKPGATLRYGHETMVMPLTCLLNLDGYGEPIDNLEKLEKHGWVNYRIFPMAANIQFVFYRKNPQDKDIYLKVLLNENEATLPLKSSVAPYYKWSDVREYYLQKLDSYEE